MSLLAEKIKNSNKELQHEIDKLKELSARIDHNVQLTNEEIENWAFGVNETEEYLPDDTIIEELQKASGEEESSSSEDNVSLNTIKHNDAVSSFNTCLQWASENNVPSHQIILLNDLRNQAIRAEINCKKQKHLTDFFCPALKVNLMCVEKYHPLFL